MTEKNKKRLSLITGLVVGGAVGSVVSLLFAPKKGKETRKDIHSKGQEIYDGGRNKAEEFLSKYRKK